MAETEGRKNSAGRNDGGDRKKDAGRNIGADRKKDTVRSDSARRKAARLAARRKAIRRKRIILAGSAAAVLVVAVILIFRLGGGGSTSASRKTDDIDNATHIAQALYKVFQSETGNASFRQVAGSQSKYETTWKAILEEQSEFADRVKENLKDYDYKNFSVSYGDLKGDTFSIVVYPEENIVEIYAGTTTTAEYMAYPSQGTYYDK